MSKKALMVAICLIGASSAHAQQPTQAQRGVGMIIDTFATVAGAWHLNAKCNFLGEEHKKTFDETIAYITPNMHSSLGMQKGMVLQIIKSSEEVASERDCNDESKHIVEQSALKAEELKQLFVRYNAGELPDQSGETQP